jgi:hypothetical protein
MRRFWIFTGIAAIITVACGSNDSTTDAGSQPTTVNTAAPPATGALAPNGPQASRDGLTIQVFGTCLSNSGTGMRLVASGFKPGEQYQTTAKYPDGKEYTYLREHGYGHADKDGHLTDWTWDCNVSPTQKDPAGTYRLRMYNSLGQWVETTFDVKY